MRTNDGEIEGRRELRAPKAVQWLALARRIVHPAEENQLKSPWLGNPRVSNQGRIRNAAGRIVSKKASARLCGHLRKKKSAGPEVSMATACAAAM